MAIAQLSYANKDHESIRKELIQRIPLITDRWTDFNESDLGMTLLELFCGVADMLFYYLDKQANEAYLPTARQRQNIINLCKIIGYRLSGPVPAQTMLRFSIDNLLDEPLVVPAKTHCKTADSGDVLYFSTVEDAVISAGSLYVDAPAIQGKWLTEKYKSDGKADQNFTLKKTDIATDKIEVVVSGEAWQPVITWYDSLNDSHHYQVETDGLDKTSIILGDGFFGVIPPNETEILVQYMVTNGADGNIGKGLVTKREGTIYNNGQTLNVHVSNIIPATGGADRESNQKAKKQAPGILRTVWKAVTKEDYQVLAESFPGVAKAKVLDCTDCNNIRYYQVNLVIAPEGGGQPSPLLQQQLQEFIEERKLITVEIRLYEPEYVPIDIDVVVYIYRGRSQYQISESVRQALLQMLDFEEVRFGQSIYQSSILSLIQNIPGVSHARLIYPVSNVSIAATEIPVVGTINITIQEVA